MELRRSFHHMDHLTFVPPNTSVKKMSQSMMVVKAKLSTKLVNQSVNLHTHYSLCWLSDFYLSLRYCL